jgi:hypothetical protein
MPGHSQPATRRTFLAGALLLPAGLLAAETDQTPLDRLATFAAALNNGDPVTALDCFLSSSPDYARLESLIQALTAQTEIACTIETIAESGDDPVRILDTDWLLQLTARTAATSNERRRQRVTIQMSQVTKKSKGTWQITSLSPLGILSPIQIR